MAKKNEMESTVDFDYWKEELDKEAKDKFQYEKVENGTILDITKVSTVTPEEQQFESRTEQNEDGTPKVIRKTVYLYEIEGKVFRVPKMLHRAIVRDTVAYGKQVFRVVKTGTGLGTRYEIEPVKG